MNAPKAVQALLNWLIKFERAVHFHHQRMAKKTGAPVIPRRSSKASAPTTPATPEPSTPRVVVNLSDSRSLASKPLRPSLTDTTQSFPQPQSTVPTPTQQPLRPQQSAEILSPRAQFIAESAETPSSAENTPSTEADTPQQKLMQLRAFRMKQQEPLEDDLCEQCNAPKGTFSHCYILLYVSNCVCTDAANIIARLTEERNLLMQRVDLLSTRIQQVQVLCWLCASPMFCRERMRH